MTVAIAVASFVTLTSLQLGLPTDCSDPSVNLFSIPAAVLPILNGTASIKTK